MNFTPIISQATLARPVISTPNQTPTNEQDAHLPALHQKVKEGDLTAVETLLESGHMPDQIDANGSTPFHIAAKENNVEAIDKLVSALYPESDENAKGAMAYFVACSNEVLVFNAQYTYVIENKEIKNENLKEVLSSFTADADQAFKPIYELVDFKRQKKSEYLIETSDDIKHFLSYINQAKTALDAIDSLIQDSMEEVLRQKEHVKQIQTLDDVHDIKDLCSYASQAKERVSMATLDAERLATLAIERFTEGRWDQKELRQKELDQGEQAKRTQTLNDLYSMKKLFSSVSKAKTKVDSAISAIQDFTEEELYRGEQAWQNLIRVLAIKNREGDTVLHCADKNFENNNGSEDLMRALISLETVDIRVDNTNNQGHSPLHYTVELGMSEAVTSALYSTRIYPIYVATHYASSSNPARPIFLA